MRIFVALTVLVSSVTFGEDSICPESRKEDLSIEESQFTKESAEAAAESLVELMQESTKGDEYFAQNYAVTWENAVHNEMIIIEGYSLKKAAKKNPHHRRKQFCDFLHNDAHVHH